MSALRRVRIPRELVVLLCLCALVCDGCGGGGFEGVPPTVRVTDPAEDVEVGTGTGDTIPITYAVSGVDGTATADVLADRDGDLGTTHDQVRIAQGGAVQDDRPQAVHWHVADAQPGAYRIFARASTVGPSVVGEAPGRALLNGPPTLSITSPAAEVRVRTGTPVEIRFVAADPDDAALCYLYADRDGDPETVADAYEIARHRPDGDGAAQTATWDTQAVEPGTFTIYGTVWDGTNPPAVAQAAGSVRLAPNAWSAGLELEDVAASVATLSDGSCLVAGWFDTRSRFGEGASAVTLASEGDRDVFLARYDPYGALVWVQTAGGAGADTAWEVVALADGSALLCGRFAGTATFGAGETDETELQGSETVTNVFVAKFGADGALAWAKHACTDEATAHLSAFADGSFLLAGTFRGTVTLGAGETNATTLTCDDVDANGRGDVFLAKYGAQGSLSWATRAGGLYYDDARGVAARADGGCFVTGTYSGSATFGADETNETELDAGMDGPDAPLSRSFLARYGSNGALAWVADLPRGARAVGARADGSCLVCGTYESTDTWGEDEVNETTLSASGSTDIFLARYYDNGTLSWVTSAGGPSYDFYGGFAVFPDGSAAMCGFQDGFALFGADEPKETLILLTSVFVARFDATGAFDWVVADPGAPLGPVAVTSSACFVVGAFLDEITLWPGEAPETTLRSRGLADVLVARYDADGPP